MTLVWNQVTRSATFDKGRWSGQHTYIVYDDGGIAINVATIAAGAGAYQVFGGGTESTAAPYMEFTNQTFKPIADGGDRQWTVDMNFESLMGDGSTPTAADAKSENRVGFTSIECNIRRVRSISGALAQPYQLTACKTITTLEARQQTPRAIRFLFCCQSQISVSAM